MQRRTTTTRPQRWLLAAGIALPLAAPAQDADPLALESAPVTPAATAGPVRAYVEGAFGRAQQRYGLPSVTLKRASLDLSVNHKLGDAWRIAFSDRLDWTSPVAAGEHRTVNSLRELYASWRDEANVSAVDLGRVNTRTGPAYGYNPTDFFRDGSQRSVTSDDPFAQRENRLGTVMARYQRLWQGGSATLALAPKLADAPSRASFSADIGSTNRSSKLLATVSATFSERASGQALLYAEQHKGAQAGVSGTALLSDAAVAHLEATYGRDRPLAADVLAGSARRDTAGRLSAGLTYTAPWRMAVTAEFQYNGFAPSRAQWDAIAARGAVGDLLVAGQTRQDLVARRAWLIYATQKDAFTKNVDVTAFVRVNADDDSRFAWLEVRRHWPKVDVALQWRRSSGRANSEFGTSAQRQAVQVLAAMFF